MTGKKYNSERLHANTLENNSSIEKENYNWFIKIVCTKGPNECCVGSIFNW